MASFEYKSKDTKTESRETTINVNVTGTKIDDEPNVGDKVIDQPIVTSTSTTTKTTTTLTSDINAGALTTTTDTTTAALTNEKNSTWLFTVKNKVEKVVKEFLPESIVFDKKFVDAFDDLDKAVKSNFNNRELHPELDWDASVRLSNDICDDEKNFIKDRKNRIRESFAKYVGVDVEEINVDDIPIIGFAGSGGGFRAMIATTGYLRALQDSGLYDCGMYLAGVSGSCWNLALQYTSMISTQENPIEALLERFRTNLTNHIASARGLLSILKNSSDHKKAVELIFGGLVQKKITDVDTGIVDIYGALLAARLLLGSDPQSQFKDFKLSEQKRFLEGGKNPLPIYTALHHARPWKDFLSKEDAALVENYEQILKEHHNQKDHYQWFEFTPFEVGCDEFEAWIPTWSFGRKFEFQKNLERIPEQNFASLIGIFGAAPCAPILIDIRQFEHFLPEGWLKREWRKCYDGTMEGLGEQKKMKFEGHHLVPASNSNNFLYHLHPPPYKLGVTNSPIMHFIDAGASNDLPLYPLTHPGRDIDIIIGFDCSSQIINHGYFEEEQRIFTERRGINSTRINADDNDIYCELYEYRPNGISGDGFTPMFKKDSCKFVYLPFLSNPKVDEKFVPSTEKFCNFANFTYTREQVDLIVRLAKQNWMDVEDKVKSTIIEIWKKKRDERLSKQQ